MLDPIEVVADADKLLRPVIVGHARPCSSRRSRARSQSRWTWSATFMPVAPASAVDARLKLVRNFFERCSLQIAVDAFESVLVIAHGQFGRMHGRQVILSLEYDGDADGAEVAG